MDQYGNDFGSGHTDGNEEIYEKTAFMTKIITATGSDSDKIKIT